MVLISTQKGPELTSGWNTANGMMKNPGILTAATASFWKSHPQPVTTSSSASSYSTESTSEDAFGRTTSVSGANPALSLLLASSNNNNIPGSGGNSLSPKLESANQNSQCSGHKDLLLGLASGVSAGYSSALKSHLSSFSSDLLVPHQLLIHRAQNGAVSNFGNGESLGGIGISTDRQQNLICGMAAYSGSPIISTHSGLPSEVSAEFRTAQL